MIESFDLGLRLVASFAAGAGVVALVTALADRLGEGPAGFIGGLPTMGAVNLLSIGLTQSTPAAIQATTLFPLGFGSTFAFLLFYAAPRRLGFDSRIVLALGLWLPISAAIALLAPRDFAFSVAASYAICFAALLLRMRVQTARAGFIPFHAGAWVVAYRGIVGGVVVVSVSALSVVSGPIIGGVFAAAPAIWSSSLFVTSRTKGVEFSRSLTWTFMLAGILTVTPYGISARYLFSLVGVWWGTLLSYLCISPLALIAWKLTNSKNGRSEKAVQGRRPLGAGP